MLWKAQPWARAWVFKGNQWWSSQEKFFLLCQAFTLVYLHATSKSSNKSKKGSSSSKNNNHAKSNVVASSSSLGSTNDSLSQVTVEQENSLFKGIIEKCVYKSLAGSKQFEEIVCKQGRHRKNQDVGF